MFLIANSCGKEITISDLGITLSARQAIDLHKVDTPISPEKSKDLQKAQRYGAIKILHKEQQQKNTIIKEREIVIKESFDKEDLLKDIKSILTQEIDKKITSSKNDNSQQMAQILAMMQQIMQNNQNSSNVKNEEADTDISENALIDLHSRSLNKMSKDIVDGKLKGEEEIKNNVLDNVDELSNML